MLLAALVNGVVAVNGVIAVAAVNGVRLSVAVARRVNGV